MNCILNAPLMDTIFFILGMALSLSVLAYMIWETWKMQNDDDCPWLR